MKKFENKKDASSRDTKVYAVFGTMGQGKSTFLAENMILPYAQKCKEQYERGEITTQRRILIYDPSGAASFAQFLPITLDELKNGIVKSNKRYKWVSGIRRITRLSEDDTEEFMNWVVSSFRNGLFLADDASSFLRLAGEPKQWLKELFRNYRNWSVDPCFVFHRLKDLPRSLRQLVSVYILFRVPDHPEGGVKWFVRNDFPMPNDLYEAWQRVELSKHDDKKRVQFHTIVVQTYDSRITEKDETKAFIVPLEKAKTKVRKYKSKKAT